MGNGYPCRDPYHIACGARLVFPVKGMRAAHVLFQIRGQDFAAVILLQRAWFVKHDLNMSLRECRKGLDHMGAKIHLTPPTIEPLILIFGGMIVYRHRLDVNFIL